MNIISCELENFSSYEKLEFDFTNQGLTLIQGPTGAGKSTLMDAMPWCLFGFTAKGGSVSEVLSWPGDKVTYAAVSIEIGPTTFHVHRKRGPKAKDNDLWWTIDSHLVAFRGKDLIDTQKLLNGALGLNYEIYLAGAYYHEFSQTAQFFSTTAKNRREITEQLVDLSLATDLQNKSSEAKKTSQKTLTSLMKELDLVSAQGKANNDSLAKANNRQLKWEKENISKVADLKKKFDKFEADRQIDLNEARRGIQTHKTLIQPLPDIELYPKCPTCNQATESPEVCSARHQKAINDKSEQRIELLSEKIKDIKLRENPHKTETTPTISPYLSEIAEISDLLDQLDAKEGDLRLEITLLADNIEDLELLQDVLADYRSTTIRNAVQGLQDTTNKLLTDHFDAELRVHYNVQDADKLEVELYKDGNACSYTQLSKGQRCLLKLAFGVSVMIAVSNYSGVSFKQLFFDESLDGLDDINKTKAFGLLQTLAVSYESVFVVEHSEALKPLFHNAYSVSIVNGKSVIEKD